MGFGLSDHSRIALLLTWAPLDLGPGSELLNTKPCHSQAFQVLELFSIPFCIKLLRFSPQQQRVEVFWTERCGALVPAGSVEVAAGALLPVPLVRPLTDFCGRVFNITTVPVSTGNLALPWCL